MCEKRSAIMYRAWLRGDCTPRVLRAARFGDAEIAALYRLRAKVLQRIPFLHGCDLACRCRLNSPWCHADILLALAAEAAAHFERTAA